jgi:S-sulfosulfanyl-L-cysteine sulfohydrolase
MRKTAALCTCAILVAGCALPVDDRAEVTLMHMGDVHGHLIPRPDVRGELSSGVRRQLGGLARMYTVVRQIRAERPNALLINTGDTIQGSAEALFTRGEALVNVLNHFEIDAFAPGNWEFVYGVDRFVELFVGPAALAPWNAIAANASYSTAEQDPSSPYAGRAGQRLLPPYVVKQVGAVRVGVLGLTTDRGPQIVGRNVTKGISFLPNNEQLLAEVERQVSQLREVEKVQLLVLASEMGLANNLRIVERVKGIDVVLSSDMHEETVEPVVVTGADGRTTVLVEEGQDGTQLGRLDITVGNGKMLSWRWKRHVIDDRIPDDPHVAGLVESARRSFVSGPGFSTHRNPFNGAVLKRPIDTVIGRTAVPLLREHFAANALPGLIGGTSHYFLADAFQRGTSADVGAIRGFRYGTQVRVGPVSYEDLFHFIPIGPQIAVARITGQQLKAQIENSADGSMNPDVSKWTGGWMFNFSDTLRMTVNPYAGSGQRVSDVVIGGKPLQADATYRYASYWYATDPCAVNTIPIAGCTLSDGKPTNIEIVRDADGSPLDGAEFVARHIEGLPNRTINVSVDRTRLLSPLPRYRYGFAEVQPLRGARPD